jgi:hypothetical protein
MEPVGFFYYCTFFMLLYIFIISISNIPEAKKMFSYNTFCSVCQFHHTQLITNVKPLLYM